MKKVTLGIQVCSIFIIAIVMLISDVKALERVQLEEISLESEHLKYSSDLLEEPAGCVSKTYDPLLVCSLRVGQGRKLDLRIKKGTITIGEKTILIRESETRFRLVEGFIRVRANSDLTIIVSSSSDWKSSARVRGDGEFFVERYASDVVVVNTGMKSVSLLSSGHDLGSLGTGMEVRLTKPDKRTGLYETGLPLPLNLESQIIRDAKLYSGPKANFKDRIDALLSMQREAADVTAKIHSRSIARKIAALELEAERRRKEKSQREAEDREIRALFRRKVLFPE